jgi:hypothetical protein
MSVRRNTITYGDVIWLAIAVAIWLIFLFGIDVVG